MTAQAGHERYEHEGQKYQAAPRANQNKCVYHREHLLSFLEPEVLKRFGGAPVQDRRTVLVATPRRQIPLRDPRRRAM